MNQVHAKRLLKLADFLDTLPRKRFDFDQFVGDDWKGTQDLSCGTTACAIGWMPAIPAFRRLGVRYKGTPQEQIGTAVDGTPIYESAYVRVCMKDSREEYNTEVGVGEQIFGLNRESFNHLFIPGYTGYGYSGLSEKATPKQVAKHIRKYVKAQTA